MEEDARTGTVAPSVTRFIFPNADVERIDGQAKTVVNIIVSWATNDNVLIRQKRKCPANQSVCRAFSFFADQMCTDAIERICSS
jgi:hypothetical protein